MIKLICLFLFLTAARDCFSQYRLSGYIEDAETHERLYGATISIKGSSLGINSNFYGYYSLKVPDGPVEVLYSFVGYQTKSLSLNLSSDTSFVVRIAPSIELNEVVVEGSRTSDKIVQTGTINIPSKQLMLLPAVGGEIDVLRAIQLLPGVQSGREGTTGMYVRGGGPDQNLVLLDGVPLYNISHLGGLFSLFNPDVIADVELIKGGFPARYGGRLSSVLNVKVKDGNKVERKTELSVGTVSSRFLTEAPLAQGKGSYLVGVRRTYIDIFTIPLTRIITGGEGAFGYHFYDLNAKIGYDISSKDKVSFSWYSGDDKGIARFSQADDAKGKSVFSWGNMLGTAKWNHLINDKLFTNLMLNYTRYRFRLHYDYRNKSTGNEQYYLYQSGIDDLGARYELDYYLSPKHNILAGIQLTGHHFTPGVNAFRSSESDLVKADTTFGSFNLNALEGSVYLEDHWTISRNLEFNLGANLNLYLVEGEVYVKPQPRATMRFGTGPNSSVKFSYALMQQNLHLLSTSGAGLPTDLWVPATKQIRPQNSVLYTAAFNRFLPRWGVEASVEAYYKEMSDLITYESGVNWLGGASDWQNKVETNGTGESKGLEFLLHKKSGKVNGWIGYTLSKTDRTFENINEGKTFPYRYDRRHDVGILLTWKINDKVDVSGTWVYGTGNAITLGTGRYMGMGSTPVALIDTPEAEYFYNINQVEHYESTNGFRMRSYHRADLGVRFTKAKEKGQRIWNAGIYNAYSRANPFYYYFAQDYPERTWKLKQISLFPIIPSVTYTYKFN